MRKSIVKIYLAVLLVGGIYAGIVLLTEKAIPCIFFLTTGFKCPGCGVSRMFISMLKFDFVSAFHYNPVIFILFFAWNLTALGAFIGKPAFFRSNKFLLCCLYVTVGVLAVFGVLRNFY